MPVYVPAVNDTNCKMQYKKTPSTIQTVFNFLHACIIGACVNDTNYNFFFARVVFQFQPGQHCYIVKPVCKNFTYLWISNGIQRWVFTVSLQNSRLAADEYYEKTNCMHAANNLFSMLGAQIWLIGYLFSEYLWRFMVHKQISQNLAKVCLWLLFYFLSRLIAVARGTKPR